MVPIRLVILRVCPNYVSTNLVRSGDNRVFHLTAYGMEFVLGSTLNPTTTMRNDRGPSSPLGRIFDRTQLGWRKLATGAAAFLALAMGYHVIFGQNGLTAYQQKRQDAQALDNQLHSLQHENDLLKGHVDRLQSDPNAIEHQAREELHYTRAGEVIYTLPAAPPSQSLLSRSGLPNQ
jgi:cell division protein FtsB